MCVTLCVWHIMPEMEVSVRSSEAWSHTEWCVCILSCDETIVNSCGIRKFFGAFFAHYNERRWNGRRMSYDILIVDSCINIHSGWKE